MPNESAHCYTPSWCRCPDEPMCRLCKQGRCPVISHNADPSGNNGPKLPATAQEVGLPDASGKDNFVASEVTLSDSVRRSIRRDCALAAREMLGSGYVPDYYASVAADFVMIAEACWREGFAAGRQA